MFVGGGINKRPRPNESKEEVRHKTERGRGSGRIWRGKYFKKHFWASSKRHARLFLRKLTYPHAGFTLTLFAPASSPKLAVRS